MRSTPLLPSLLAAAVFVAAGAPAVAEQQVVLLGSSADWRQARQIIEAYGGRVVHVLPPSVLVGDVPEGAALALAGHRVVRGETEARSLLGTGLGPEAEAALRLLAPEASSPTSDSMLRVLPDGRVVRRPIQEWEEPPLERPARDPQLRDAVTGAAIGNTFYNTSDFMAGDVAVAILRPESTGVIEASSEDWTSGEVANSLTQILAALDKLSNDSPRGKLAFVYRTESFGAGVAGTVACDYEAILHGNWDNNVVLNFLGKLGYVQAVSSNRLTEWVNDARSDLGTDWAFGIIVVDNSTDTTRGRASAFITGPGAWLFQQYSSNVYHHESGHIFGARDEYHPDAGQQPTALHGYTQEVNANSMCCTAAHVAAANPPGSLDGRDTGYFAGAGEGISAVMINNVDYASPWTRGQWGIWDLDGDGIYDTQDTFPTVVLNAPTGTPALVFTGNASATPLKRESGAIAHADITVNKIAGVEWRLNGGPWQNASASDGAFNSSSEGFTFTTPGLRNGSYAVEARARDHFGNAGTVFPRREVTVAGSGVTNNPPQPALQVAPALGSTGTGFKLSAVGSLDAEDSNNLQYRWDYENDGTFDTGFSTNPTVTRFYATPGGKTAKVEVRDPGGATASRTVSLVVSGANVAPAATFTANRGAAFGAAPVVFTFDASGVSDGEDSTALEVRWDFEDDGIWDTPYSTLKTVSHDYAAGNAVTVSQEVATGLIYYFAGNNADAYAQGFTAAGTGVSRAELYISNYNNAVPGGTCTVGLRSSLTGPFLSSVTRNQSELLQSTWNVFDFPDVAVTGGSTYYLTMVCSDKDMMWLASSSNPIPGQQMWYSFDGGANWASVAPSDFRFRLYDSALSTIPLTKSRSWRVRMEVKDTLGQTAQTVRDVWTNAYDTPPTVTLGSLPTTGTTATSFNLTATGADVDFGTTWDGYLQYRWDVNGDGNFETEFGDANTRSATFTQAGIYQATVEVRDRYHATARAVVPLTVSAPLGPAQLAINAGNNQSGLVNTAVAVPPSVIVRDASSNPVAGALVVFSVGAGGGSIGAATQTTNGSGIATAGTWTMGPNPSLNTLNATAPALPGSLATFNASTCSGAGSDEDLDGIPTAIEPAESTNPCLKDNDVFGSARLFAMQQYRDFLGREGEAFGIGYWTNSIDYGMSRATVTKQFFDSAEFQGVAAPITRLYFAYFNRIPDKPGLDYWLIVYRAGMPLNDISQVFAGSPEFVNTYGSLDNTQFVTLVYNNVLGRPPDAPGLAYWLYHLDHGLMTRGQVMLGFSESPEYRATSYNRVFVTMVYYGMLRRVPEPAGFNYWIAYLNGGASALNLITGFLESAEYRGRFLP